MKPGDLVVQSPDVFTTASGIHLYRELDHVGIVKHSIHRIEFREVLMVLAFETRPTLRVERNRKPMSSDERTVVVRSETRVLLLSGRGRTYGWARAKYFIPAPYGELQ